MKNVLVLIHDDPGQEARFQAALDIVRTTGGHLTCLDVVGDKSDASQPSHPSPAMGALLIGQEERIANADREHLLGRLREADISWSLEEARGSIETGLEAAAGLADLIVLNPRLEQGGPDMRTIASNLLLKSHKPVLLVPESSARFDPAGAAMIAWDGSAPCMASLTAAVRLLKFAASVRLLEIQGSSKGSLRDAVAYLSRHEIEAEVDRLALFKGAKQDVGEVIEEMCVKYGCSYCVMGAYGHSPIHEAVFGGVTRRMLTQSRIPLLLAH